MLASFVNGPCILSFIRRHNFIELLLASTTVCKNDPKLTAQTGCKFNENHKRLMHTAVMCTLSLYDVIGIMRHLHIKLKSFSKIAQPLHKEAIRGCSLLYIIAEKSVIMREAFLVDVSIKQSRVIYYSP